MTLTKPLKFVFFFLCTLAYHFWVWMAKLIDKVLTSSQLPPLCGRVSRALLYDTISFLHFCTHPPSLLHLNISQIPKMNQKCFLTSSYHHLLIKSYYFLFFSHLTQIAFSFLDPKFQSCQPQSCGNGPNITFLFYIRDRQLDFCGFPLFDIFCGVNNYPFLNLFNNHYIIQ